MPHATGDSQQNSAKTDRCFQPESQTGPVEKHQAVKDRKIKY
jgi:hypothetical protein